MFRHHHHQHSQERDRGGGGGGEEEEEEEGKESENRRRRRGGSIGRRQQMEHGTEGYRGNRLNGRSGNHNAWKRNKGGELQWIDYGWREERREGGRGRL
jgi:hypothetical protein